MVMNARPILFSGAMVRALLDDRKTQTRRIVKPQDLFGSDGGLNVTRIPGSKKRQIMRELPEVIGAGFICPYGKPGDLLWVRETWAPTSVYLGMDPGMDALAAGGFYRADYPPGDLDEDIERWTPSIHMPRWASRLTLELTDVRVERLHDMDGATGHESDALLEGINRIHHGDGDYYYSAFRNEPHPDNWCDPFDAFCELWVSINGQDSWDA